MADFEVLYKQKVKAKAELSTVWPKVEGMPQHARQDPLAKNTFLGSQCKEISVQVLADH